MDFSDSTIFEKCADVKVNQNLEREIHDEGRYIMELIKAAGTKNYCFLLRYRKYDEKNKVVLSSHLTLFCRDNRSEKKGLFKYNSSYINEKDERGMDAFLDIFLINLKPSDRFVPTSQWLNVRLQNEEHMCVMYVMYFYAIWLKQQYLNIPEVLEYQLQHKNIGDIVKDFSLNMGKGRGLAIMG